MSLPEMLPARFPSRALGAAAWLLLALFAAGCGGTPAAGKVVEVSQSSFRSLVIASPRPVVLEFWTHNCVPCRELEPHLASLAEDHPELLVAKINSDDNEGIAGEYGVQLVPTVLILVDGEVRRKQISPNPDELAALVAPFLDSK